MTVIVYINLDPFAVNRERLFQIIEESNGDWIKVTDWIEQCGTFVGANHQKD